MKLKKALMILTVFLISASCLTGCGNKDETEESITETTAVTDTTIPIDTALPETTTAVIATENPVYPTNVPEIHKSTTASNQNNNQTSVNYNWDVMQDHTITGTSDIYTTDIVIPINCTNVSDNAFSNNETVERVSFTNPYTVIGSFAFNNCPNLEELELPWYIDLISPYTFQDCISLRILDIPETVTQISEGAFYGCTSLMNLTLHEGLQKIDTIAFYGCSNLSLVSIPESVTEIGDYAFGNCAGLVSVFVPASVTKVGLYPFSGSANLTLEEQPTIQVFVKEGSWMDLNFDMVCGGTSCVKLYY